MFCLTRLCRICYWRNGVVEIAPEALTGRALFCFDRFQCFGACPVRARRDQSGDPLCILRLFIMVIFTLVQKIDKSNPGILAKTKPNSGVSEPPGDVVVAARAGEEGTEMKTESQTRAFWPIGSNRCNAASLPFTGVQQTRVAR